MIERSRSGRDAHVWIKKRYPSQDVASSIGNLIALPLQGQALKNCNSAFAGKNWNDYPNQWDILIKHTEKLSTEEIEKYMEKWQGDLAKEKRNISFGIFWESSKTLEEKREVC